MNVTSTAAGTTVPASSEGVVAAGVYAGGRRVADIAIEEAGAWARRPGHVVWIGLHEPDKQLLRSVQRQFDLHPLAIEDADQPTSGRRSSNMATLCSSWRGRRSSSPTRIAFGETHFSSAAGYVVSVRHGPRPPTAGAATLRGLPARSPTARNTSSMPSSISSSTITSPVVEAIQAEVETIEDQVLATRAQPSEIERLYCCVAISCACATPSVPLVEVCRRLEHSELPPIAATMQPLFRDVTDHVRRVQEEIDSLREVLAFAFEASLMTARRSRTRSRADSLPGPLSWRSRPRSPASTG